MLKKIIVLILLLNCGFLFSQEKNTAIILPDYIKIVKNKYPSIKNSDTINVMINDVLIESQETFMIDPKNVIRIEILEVDPKKNPNLLNPSIIIKTKEN